MNLHWDKFLENRVIFFIFCRDHQKAYFAQTAEISFEPAETSKFKLIFKKNIEISTKPILQAEYYMRTLYFFSM